MTSEPETLLRLSAVLQATGLSRSNLYRQISLGAFPKPIALTQRSRAWPQSAISAWIHERIGAAQQ